MRSISGRFEPDLQTRWLYFLVSFMGTAMVGTGLVMWTVKRRQRLPYRARPHFGFRLVERLNIASVAGLSIAMTAFLWANRLLPHPLEGRADLGDPRVLRRLGPDAAACPGASGEVGLGRAIMGGIGAAVSVAGSQRTDDATSVVAQPGRRRLDLRRYGYHVLGARFAACGLGAYARPGRGLAPSPGAKPNRDGLDHRRLRQRQRDESPAVLLCYALAGFTALACCHASPTARCLRQVSAVDHDIRSFALSALALCCWRSASSSRGRAGALAS